MTFDKYLIVLELKICVAEFCNTELKVIGFISFQPMNIFGLYRVFLVVDKKHTTCAQMAIEFVMVLVASFPHGHP